MLLLALIAAAAAETDAAEADAEDDNSWYALPTFDYASDTGFGFGAAAGLYIAEPGLAPYKAAIELDLYATTRRIQYHSLWFDVLRVGGLPLRLQGGLGFTATVSDNYCGVAGSPDCPPSSEVPLGETTEHLLRYSAPEASPTARCALDGWPVELMGGLSAVRYRPGVFRQTTPYDDSLYAEAFPEGETGVMPGAMVGLFRDTRDSEINPLRGLITEASVRGSVGQWRSVGANAVVTGFVPMHPTLTSATRLIYDQTWGSLPTQALAGFGGWFGGSGLGGDVGRGIRAGRFIGRQKLMGQQELRWMPLRWSMWDTEVVAGGAGFVDGGRVADGADAVTAWGTGGGIRIDTAGFVIRFDVAVSPVEGWQPYSYIDFAHAF